MDTSNPHCLFCGIVDGRIPADVVASTDRAVAFRDINPIAPVHVLVAPRTHVASIHELADDDVLAACVALARAVADQEGIADAYRVATNVGAGGGQSVFHLHFHVVGGRQLGHVDAGIPQ